jgi:phosphohistidine phosphatase SixA
MATAQLRRWLLVMVWIGTSVAIPATAAAATSAQGDDEIGFVLVARVLPEEWSTLATAYPAPSGPATPRAAGTPVAPERGLLTGEELVEALRGSGYVIYFRHARTDFSQPDTDRQNLENCATQRNLTDEGRADARAIGAAILTLGIPVGEVLASEYCRTRETAELIFGRVTPARDLTSRVSTATEEERAERIEALRRLLATAPAPETNTVLVGHQFNLEDATGVTIAEGEAAIFLPLDRDGDGMGTPAADDRSSAGSDIRIIERPGAT